MRWWTSQHHIKTHFYIILGTQWLNGVSNMTDYRSASYTPANAVARYNAVRCHFMALWNTSLWSIAVFYNQTFLYDNAKLNTLTLSLATISYISVLVSHLSFSHNKLFMYLIICQIVCNEQNTVQMPHTGIVIILTRFILE